MAEPIPPLAPVTSARVALVISILRQLDRVVAGINRDAGEDVGRELPAGKEAAVGPEGHRLLVRAYLRAPSMTLTGARVRTILVSVKPAASYSDRNSASDRWRPPVLTSMFTSFAAAPRLASVASIRGG